VRGWSDDGFDENHDEFVPNGIEPVIDKDMTDHVNKLAQADLEGEIRLATEADDVAEESSKYMARECGNCHNIMYITPFKATNQVFDGEGWVNCECGAPILGPMLRGYWTP
jgi:hypothetical protein